MAQTLRSPIDREQGRFSPRSGTAEGGWQMTISVTRHVREAALAAMMLGSLAAAPAAAQTLRVVQHANLTILDPIWTTTYVTRNHGYLIYDTLFATDEKHAIKPQMVDKHEVSADK